MGLASSEKKVQYSFIILIVSITLTGVLAMLAVPVFIGEMGLQALWIPLLLVIPLTLQGVAASKLKDIARQER